MPSFECRGKKKLWSVRFNIIDGHKEVTKRLSGFEKKKDAELAYRNFMLEYEEKQKIIQTDENIMERNFCNVFEEYKKYKQDKIKDSTFYDIINIYNKHIEPFFCNFKIKQITKPIVLEWQQSMEGFSYKYKTKIRGVLYSFFKYLYYYYDIENVISHVEPFKKPITKKEMSIWSEYEFKNFINTFEDDILFKTFFTFLYYTGCRLGEALAINYNDIDFKTRTIKISKSITTKIYKKTTEPYSVTTPKNASSIRTILLPNNIINCINEYLDYFPTAKQSKFLFGDDRPLDDHTIYRRLESHTKECGNKKIRIHDFRHSHASLLIQLGANIVLVAKRLGHSSTEQTLNTYAHLFPNSEQELIDLLNQKAI